MDHRGSDNKDRARSFWAEVFNAQNPDRMDEFVSARSVNHNALAGTSDGPDGLRASFGRIWAAFPDMQFEIETLVAEGDRVVCVGLMGGTHEGTFAGMPATGRSFRARHIHMLTFDAAGMITEHLAVRDDISQLKQLGLLPESMGRPSTTPPAGAR